MVPATTHRRQIPAALYPAELADAAARLRAWRARGWMFWGSLPLMTWGLWLTTGLLGAGFLEQLLLALLGGAALAVARVGWWIAQRPARLDAHQTLERWRRLPADPRWDAAMVLLDRVDRLGGADPELRETSRRLIAVLFGLYEDIRALDRTLAADRVLDGDGELSDRYHRLAAVRTRREAQIDVLIDGLRDLHLELNEQLAEHIGPLQDRLQELLDRLEADREVVRLAGVRRRVLGTRTPV